MEEDEDWRCNPRITMLPKWIPPKKKKKKKKKQCYPNVFCHPNTFVLTKLDSTTKKGNYQAFHFVFAFTLTSL